MTQVATAEQATTTSTYQQKSKRGIKFGYWFPQNAISKRNPFYNYELSNAPDSLQLKGITVRWMIYVVFAMLGVWVGTAILVMTDSTSRFNTLPDLWYSIWQTIGWIFVAISFGDRFIYDFICLVSGLNRINKEIKGGSWELISVTDVNVDYMVQAKHAFVQTRVWRAMSIIMGLRLGIVLVAMVHGLFALIITNDEYSNLGFLLEDMVDAIIDEPSQLLVLLILLLAFVLSIYFYVIEARWRLRVITAASLSVSSRIRSTTMGLLYGLGTIIAFWISQIFVAGVVTFVVSVLFSIMIGWANVVYFSPAYNVGVSLFLLFTVLFIASIAYINYHDMVDYWLSNASRRLITLEGGSTPRRYYPTRAFMTVFTISIVIWAFFAFWAIFFNNNNPYGDYNDLYFLGFNVNQSYGIGLTFIFMGLSLALGLQFILDFIILLSMKYRNYSVQYTTGRSRIGREVNIVMALRLSVICTGLLHFILGLKFEDNLTTVNVLFSFGIAGFLLIVAIFEMQWSVTTVRQLGHAIETRVWGRFRKTLAIYGVMIVRWVIYGGVMFIVALVLSRLPFMRIDNDDSTTRILAFVFPLVMVTSMLIFAVHMLIRANLPAPDEVMNSS